jgi:hypothetical protein
MAILCGAGLHVPCRSKALSSKHGREIEGIIVRAAAEFRVVTRLLPPRRPSLDRPIT